MQNSLARFVVAALCAGSLLLTGCETLSGSSPEDAGAASESASTAAAADSAAVDTSDLDPRVVRLYRLEAQLLAADGDSARTGRLLDQAMAELAALLQDAPEAIERQAVQDVYRGLTAEYRRFHGYGTDPDSMVTARANIFRVRADLFARLEGVDQPLLEDVMMPESAKKLETSVPLTMNRLVKQSMEYLQRTPEKHVNNWLQRSQTYFPMINHVLAEEGVPQELRYLAMIESGLNPRARSWAGAVGMWQFMRGTGRMYGLEVDAWVDERQDPEKATRAAARHLKDLHDRFGDWHLALAAFNCGGGCVSRAVRRASESDPTYWDVYDDLPRETRGYVPMFIATTLVASNPQAYGIDDPRPAPTYAYDYVWVPGSMLSLREIADLAGTETSVIRALNPELRRNTVPPSRDGYQLRIPLGAYPQFALNFAELPPSKKHPATTYRVKSGDTLSEIAQTFGTTTRRLQRLNDIRGTVINVGDRLAVPVREYDGSFTARADQPVRVQYDANPPTRPIDALSLATRSETSRSETSRSETSRSETSRSETSRSEPNAGASASDETPVRTASTGDEGDAAAETTSSSSSETSSSQASSQASSSQNTSPQKTEAKTRTRPETYTVRRGDTIIEIADRFNLWTKDLRAWNDLRGDRIMPGDELRLYPPEDGDGSPSSTSSDAATASTASSGAVTYRVKSGDTLAAIAEAYDVSVRELRTWNGLRGSRIMPGQTLTIYTGSGSLPSHHVVKRGDTLGSIARTYDTTISRLRQLNNLNGSRIYPGQKLRVSAE
jgi:membrane-bound lytic murein transglycosylase D